MELLSLIQVYLSERFYKNDFFASWNAIVTFCYGASLNSAILWN